MPSPTFPINVNVNFNGVSYNASTGTWTGQPSWNVVPNVQGVTPIKAGTGDNIISWNLNAAAPPRGFTAAFPQTNAIAMQSGYPGTTPATTNSTTVTSTDNFNGLQANQIYEYVITVTLTNGTVSQDFTYDPDVVNEAGTVNVAALVRTRK